MTMSWAQLSLAVQQVYNQYRYTYNSFIAVKPADNGIVFEVEEFDGYLKYFYDTGRVLRWSGSWLDGYWLDEDE